MNNQELRFQRLQFDYECAFVSPIHLNPDEIHVWGFVLDIGEPELACAVKLLPDDELARADRLMFAQHRQRFLAAHAGLGLLLSRYTGISPRELVMQKMAAGKPFLRDWPSIHFNLSHSHERALVAVSLDRDVGIDLEKVRVEVDVRSLAKRFLSVKDQVFVEQGEPAHMHERFLKMWVAREAVCKARGTGLTFPLHHDHVELTEDGTGGCLVLGGSSESKPVQFLPVERGWIGAVAAEGVDWKVTYGQQTEQ